MKKNIIKSIMVAVFAIFAGYNVYLANANNNVLTDTMLANVEALAQSETWDWYCVGDLDICLKDEIGIIFGKKFYE